MGKLNWPTLSRKRPKDIFEHASILKDDFQALHDHVKTLKANKRHLAKLPSGYTSKIFKGISLGVTEAIDNEYYPKFISDIDRDLFCKTLLQAIRSELATEAHDRIPLLEFDTLHSSYRELVEKLSSHLALDPRKRDMTPDSDLERNQGNGSRPLISHIINQAAIPDFSTQEDDMDLEIDEEAHDILRTLRTIEDQGTLLSHQLEFLDGYTEDQSVPDFVVEHGRSEVDGEEEVEGVQPEDGEKEETHDGTIVKYGACNADAIEESSYLQGDDAGANAMRGFDRDKGIRKTKKNYAPPRKEEIPDIQDVAATVENGFAAAFSKFVTFEIKHQATVNRLALATPQEILNHLYQSLQKIIATQENLADLIHLSEPRLVDDGDVMFRADTDSQDLFHPAPIDAWEAEFEAGISPKVPTFNLALHDLEIKSMNIATRKSKAEAIHELIGCNKNRLSSLHGDSDIIDLSWTPHPDWKRSTSLLIEFSNRQLANEVLQQGLAWQGEMHSCRMINKNSVLTRCSRCQAYGHMVARCPAPYCCGTCAEAHPTENCTSTYVRCAACGGPHRAKCTDCPARIAEKKKLFRFPTPEPAAENGKREAVTVRSDVENAGGVEGRILPSSTSGSAASRKNLDVDDEQVRLARCGQCQGYGHVASKCSARLRCGKCALHHHTWKCQSRFVRCAGCNGKHMASSAICPARPLEKGRSQQLQKSEMPHMPPLRTSTPDTYPREPEIKIEPQSPSSGAVARPNRTSKKRSMLGQVEELVEVVSKGNSREMAWIKDHLETLQLAMRAEGGDILATTPRSGKRGAQKALMRGALQDRFGSPKRIKFEEFHDSTVYNS